MATSALPRQPLHDPRSGFSGSVKDDGFYAPPFAAEPQKPKPQEKRIIDVEKEMPPLPEMRLQSMPPW